MKDNQRYPVGLIGGCHALMTATEANLWIIYIFDEPEYKEYEQCKSALDHAIHEKSESGGTVMDKKKRLLELEKVLFLKGVKWCDENLEDDHTEILAAQYITLAQVVDIWDGLQNSESKDYHAFLTAVKKIIPITGLEEG